MVPPKSVHSPEPMVQVNVGGVCNVAMIVDLAEQSKVCIHEVQ